MQMRAISSKRSAASCSTGSARPRMMGPTAFMQAAYGCAPRSTSNTSRPRAMRCARGCCAITAGADGAARSPRSTPARAISAVSSQARISGSITRTGGSRPSPGLARSSSPTGRPPRWAVRQARSRKGTCSRCAPRAMAGGWRLSPMRRAGSWSKTRRPVGSWRCRAVGIAAWKASTGPRRPIASRAPR